LEDKLSVIAKNSSPNASPVQLLVVREQGTGNREQGTGNREQGTGQDNSLGCW
jgi:hypothetical protein